MGYSIYINSETEIDCLEEIIEELPEFYTDGFSKQSWGWTLYSDVSLSDNKKQIKISGSFGVSGKHAEGFTLQIVNKLLHRGYKIICKSDDFEL
jgi:hypothetical protein